MKIEKYSRITCPKCGFAKLEEMPLNVCVFYYECPACQIILRPKKGDCCVFCSYGSMVCPPVQEQKHHKDAKLE